MSDPNTKAIATALIVIFIAVATFDTSIQLFRGQTTLQEAVAPGWLEFASANPLLFAVIAVVGIYIFGRIFANFLEAL